MRCLASGARLLFTCNQPSYVTPFLGTIPRTLGAVAAAVMAGCGGITRWWGRLNPNVRNRFLYDFLLYAGAGMWAR